MALAARIRGDSLTPVRASLELADALFVVDETSAKTVFQQAYEATERIATK